MDLAYFVTSSQCFIHSQNIHKIKSERLHSSFTECPFFCVVFGWGNKRDPGNGIALNRMPFFNDHSLSEEEGKKWIDFVKGR